MNHDRDDVGTVSLAAAADGLRATQGTPEGADTWPGEQLAGSDVPARIDRFELIRELGRGGMGRVYLARDTRLGRLVALKLLHTDSERRTRAFLVEARATARCQHENIVVIHEVDEWQGRPYLVLEYLQGTPLARLVRGEPLSPRRALELITPVVRALVSAHELGIVHRDLKPENVFVTRTGVIKVLDFGIAKLFAEVERGARGVAEHEEGPSLGSGAGTVPYMAPEQWRGGEVDARTDLWAIGIMLWEMLQGRHPLSGASVAELAARVPLLVEPMPRLAEARPDLPAELTRLVDRCLEKRMNQRWSSARELADALDALQPAQRLRPLSSGENPYPGMRAFQESEAARFFGRTRDVAHLVSRVRAEPLVGLVGPSGVGKSSLVRAGLIPELRALSESWEVLTTRPGRHPLASLATLLEESGARPRLDADLLSLLRAEPGTLGALLRARARERQGRICLFIDQFEELYTLVPDAEERRAYTACLRGAADDPSAPLRIVVSMRSDFLDRAAEDRAFLDQLGAQLHFLAPIDAEGLREALVAPLEQAGFRFESDALVREMLESVESNASALPLLQFTAEKLWDARDTDRRVVSLASYRALGGVAGALSAHADDVLAPLSPSRRKLMRALFRELVTADGTRALVETSELARLGAADEVDALVSHLTSARLLSAHARDDGGAAVELVHESLITTWPTLRRWREESAVDLRLMSQLRAAAKQWDERGRDPGLLWRGDAVHDVRHLNDSAADELGTRERDFLAAALDLARRSARRTRQLTIAAFAVLLALTAAAIVALVWVRGAEQRAQEQRAAAVRAAATSRAAEARIKEQLATIQRKEKEREQAQRAAEQAEAAARTGSEKLARTYEQLEAALGVAEKARATAESEQRRSASQAEEIQKLAEAERAAKKELARLLEEERARVLELEREQRRLSTELK